MYRPSRDALRDFGKRVLSGAARELSYLQAIEQTLDALLWDQKVLKMAAEFAVETSDRIKRTEPKEQLDKDGSLVGLFGQAQAKVEEYYLALIKKRDAALADPALTEEDGVAEAYTDTIALAADLHNALNDLRWAIMEHDAALSPTDGKTYGAENLEGLFAELKS